MTSVHLKFKAPFTCLLSGPTGSGKTQLVKKIIHNKNRLIDKDISKILWFYSEWQPIFNNLVTLNKVQFIQGPPSYDLLIGEKPDLIIIDDLMNEISRFIMDVFTKLSHHLNFSVILIVQNLFFNSPIMRTISLNSHYIILMKNPRDKSQIRVLAHQMYPGNNKFFIDSYNDATQEPYSYIRADLTPSTPDVYRLISNFESPVIYRPK